MSKIRSVILCFLSPRREMIPVAIIVSLIACGQSTLFLDEVGQANINAVYDAQTSRINVSVELDRETQVEGKALLFREARGAEGPTKVAEFHIRSSNTSFSFVDIDPYSPLTRIGCNFPEADCRTGQQLPFLVHS